MIHLSSASTNQCSAVIGWSGREGLITPIWRTRGLVQSCCCGPTGEGRLGGGRVEGRGQQGSRSSTTCTRSSIHNRTVFEHRRSDSFASSLHQAWCPRRQTFGQSAEPEDQRSPVLHYYQLMWHGSDTVSGEDRTVPISPKRRNIENKPGCF